MKIQPTLFGVLALALSSPALSNEIYPDFPNDTVSSDLLLIQPFGAWEYFRGADGVIRVGKNDSARVVIAMNDTSFDFITNDLDNTLPSPETDTTNFLNPVFEPDFNFFGNQAEIQFGLNGLDDDGNGIADDFYGIATTTTLGTSTNEADWTEALDAIANTDQSHGETMTGIAARITNNGLGSASAAYNPEALMIRITNNLTLDLARTVRGMDYATLVEANVLNLSLSISGGTFTWVGGEWGDFSKTVNLLTVSAAGLGNTDLDSIPSNPAALDNASGGMTNMFVILHSDGSDNYASGNFGASNVDIASPGPSPSEATALASSATALLVADDPQAHYSEIIERFIYSADIKDDLRDRSLSDGRINLTRAMAMNDLRRPRDLQVQSIVDNGDGTADITLIWANQSISHTGFIVEYTTTNPSTLADPDADTGPQSENNAIVWQEIQPRNAPLSAASRDFTHTVTQANGPIFYYRVRSIRDIDGDGELYYRWGLDANADDVVDENFLEVNSTLGQFEVDINGTETGASSDTPASWPITQVDRLSARNFDTVVMANANQALSNPVPAPPAAPAFVCALAVDTELDAETTTVDTVYLHWDDNSDNEAGFIIERSEDGGSTWHKLAQVPANTTRYMDTDYNTGINTTALASSELQYRICAFNAGNPDSISAAGTARAATASPRADYIATHLLSDLTGNQDGDSIPTVVDFALINSPTVPGALPVFTDVPVDKLVIEFNRWEDPEVSYTVEATTGGSLDTFETLAVLNIGASGLGQGVWSSVKSGVVIDEFDNLDGTVSVRITDDSIITTNPRYTRITVSE